MSGVTNILSSYRAAGYGTRAQAFFTQVESVEGVSLGSTIKDAVDSLFNGLHTDGLIDKNDSSGAGDLILAMYPIVGGAAASIKYNALRPTDTDADWRITFSGGWTHAANQTTPNGTTGYGNTHFKAKTVFGSNQGGLFMDTNMTGTTYPYGSGCFQDPPNTGFHIGYGDGGTLADGPRGRIRGLTVISDSNYRFNQPICLMRESSTSLKVYANGSLDTTVTTSETTDFPDIDFYLGAWNSSGSTILYNDNPIQFFAFLKQLTSTQVSNLTSRVNTFQSALSR